MHGSSIPYVRVVLKQKRTVTYDITTDVFPRLNGSSRAHSLSIGGSCGSTTGADAVPELRRTHRVMHRTVCAHRSNDGRWRGRAAPALLMVLFTEAAFVVRTAAGDCAQCDAGYYDATDCDAYNWGCGSDCEGGAYWTDVGCGCACELAPSGVPTMTARPSTSPAPTPPICVTTCYDHSCDYWIAVNPTYTCDFIELNFGCDCADCECASTTNPPTTAPSATPRPSTSPVPTPPICLATCFGHSCEYWLDETSAYTCGIMESNFGCDCAGCDCCIDTDNGATDLYGDGCQDYAAVPGWCGKYDSDSFSSDDMCCGCGAGSTGAAPSPSTCLATCYGHSCEYWLGENSTHTCGIMESGYFGCDCTGCDCCIDTDHGATDPFGDGCEDYAANPGWCGEYDSGTFSSNGMCCGCGGGFFSAAPSAAPTTTHTPTDAPTVTPQPSVSPVPTVAMPTSQPTEPPTTVSPTPSPVDAEAGTFTELEVAISQAASSGAKLSVRLLADIMITATLYISSQVMIYSREGAILRGGGSRRLFWVEYGGRLSGANITLRGGHSSSYGGAVVNSGTMDLANCILADNSATDGGAMYSFLTSETTILDGCTLRGNSAGVSGGALRVGGRADLNACELTMNYALYGGAIVSADANLISLNACRLTGNAGEVGGAIYTLTTTTTLINCTLEGNSASFYGGAIYTRTTATTLSNCTLEGNSAYYSGGAVYDSGGTVRLQVCELLSNRAFLGGAVYTYTAGTSDLRACELTGNYANTGGAICTVDGAVVSLRGCSMTQNSAEHSGGAIYNQESTVRLNACLLQGNSASDSVVNLDGEITYGVGGVVDNYGGIVDFYECSILDNVASTAGAINNNGGTANLDGCVVMNNTASLSGGAFSSFGGTMTLTACDLKGNAAQGYGGILFQQLGVIAFKDCTLTDNHATSLGSIVYSENSAVTRFDRCAFRGAYETDECVISSGDEESKFLLFHHRAFESGVICSASPVLVYGANVSVPFSSSHEAAMTCQSPDIFEYCQYDCTSSAAEMGGISCSCTSDEQRFDPELLADKGAQSCLNSALLSVPETEFTLAVTKQRGPSSLKIVFANAGDKILIWNLTNIGASSIAEAWSIKPAGGYLLGCGVGTVEVALLTWNLTARANAYKMWLVLTSNSYRDSTYNISISAFVAAEPVPSRCSVNVTSHLSQLAAGNAVRFIVEPVDAAGVTILDTASQAYFANLEHSMSTTSVPCRVVYDPSSGQQEGACEIPTVVCKSDTTFSDCVPSPPVGEFLLDVEDADGNAVGATQHSFVIKNCPESYYKTGGGCSLCLDRVFCAAGSAVADWQLAPGDWRATPKSTKVHACRFGQVSCPGGVMANPATGPDPYCAPEYVGPRCSECHPDYFLSWAGDGGCHKCATGRSHGPTIGLLCGLLVIGSLSLAGALRKVQKRRAAATSPGSSNSSLISKIEKLYLLAKVKFFLLFLACQVEFLATFFPSLSLLFDTVTISCAPPEVISQFATISSGTGDEGFPEPAATFVRVLGVTNLDFLGFVPLGCVFRNATFYHKVFFKCCAPLVAMIILGCYPLSARLRGNPTEMASRIAKRAALLLLEIALPNIATSLVQVFVCDSFDGKASFLRAQLTLRCNDSNQRISWVFFSAIALVVYVVGGK